MKAGVKTFLQIISGVAAGASVSAIITYNVTKKKFLKLSDERVKSLEEYIEKLQSERLSKDLGYGDPTSEEEETEGNEEDSYAKKSGQKKAEDVDPRSSIGNKLQSDPNYVRYSSISKGTYSKVDERYDQIAAQLEHPMDSDEDETEEYDYEDKIWSEESNSKKPPEIIPYEAVGSRPDMEEDELYFYTDDETLVTSDDEIVTDVYALIGDAIEKSGFAVNNELLLCVRNYRRGVDYQVSKIRGKYSDKDIY